MGFVRSVIVQHLLTEGELTVPISGNTILDGKVAHGANKDAISFIGLFGGFGSRFIARPRRWHAAALFAGKRVAITGYRNNFR